MESYVAGPFEISRSTIESNDLRQVDLFRDLDPRELDHLAAGFVELRVKANRLVLQQGQPAEAFFVVAEGGVAVFRDAVGMPVQLLARLRRGDFFGEIGLFARGRHSASVRTSEASRILKITRQRLLDFLDNHPPIFQKLQMAAARRHSADMASALELGRRREVRVRCSHEVILQLADGSRSPVMLDNLSLGGVCLGGTPAHWQVGDEHEFSLAIRESELPLTGRVTWRRGDSVGLTFVDRSPNHDVLIQMATRLLLELES